MRNIIETLFDLLFPKGVDENGNEVEPEGGDDSYATKVFSIVAILITTILIILSSD